MLTAHFRFKLYNGLRNSDSLETLGVFIGHVTHKDGQFIVDYLDRQVVESHTAATRATQMSYLWQSTERLLRSAILTDRTGNRSDDWFGRKAAVERRLTCTTTSTNSWRGRRRRWTRPEPGGRLFSDVRLCISPITHLWIRSTDTIISKSHESESSLEADLLNMKALEAWLK